MSAVVVIGALATAFMVGVVWFCQVVHYPLFASVGEEGFTRYHELHSTRVTWLIAVPWLTELVCASWLVLERPAGVSPWLAVVGAVLAFATVAITALVQGRAHTRLAGGFDADGIRSLVRGNGPRTLVWTAHAVVFGAMLLAL